MTANPIEYNLDICSEDAQYTLHDKNQTAVRFSIILNHVPYTVRLIFTPFRRPGCNLIYHEYEIRCIIPLGAPVEAVSRSKHLIVAEVQRLYTKCFAKPGHRLVLQTEFEVSSKSGPSSEVASNLVATAKHQLTSNVEPLRKRQKPLQGDRTPPDVDAELTPWTVETFNHDVQKTHPSAIPPKPSAAMITWVSESPIEAVQKSYRSAIRDGRLKYHREPELVSEPVGLKPWDPYVLTAAMVSRARLDSNKVASITQNVNSTVVIVPKAFEWMAKTQEYNLAPEDVKRILQRAFVHDESSSIQQSKQVDKLPPILRIAAGALRRAEELQDRPDDFRREEAILRMVAYASTEVSVVAGEATNDEVDTWIGPLAGGKDWLRRCRWIARFWFWLMRNLSCWKGRDLPLFFMLMGQGRDIPLRTLFQPVFPASAGEFVWALSLKMYWNDLPTLTKIPGLMEIEMALLDGLVKHETICSALGCTDAYLEGLNPNLFLEVCPKMQLISTVATSERREDQTEKDDGLDVDVDTDPFFSYVYDTIEDADNLFCAGFNIP